MAKKRRYTPKRQDVPLVGDWAGGPIGRGKIGKAGQMIEYEYAQERGGLEGEGIADIIPLVIAGVIILGFAVLSRGS